MSLFSVCWHSVCGPLDILSSLLLNHDDTSSKQTATSTVSQLCWWIWSVCTLRTFKCWTFLELSLICGSSCPHNICSLQREGAAPWTAKLYWTIIRFPWNKQDWIRIRVQDSAKLVSDHLVDASSGEMKSSHGGKLSIWHRETNCCFGFLSNSHSSTTSHPAKAWASSSWQPSSWCCVSLQSLIKGDVMSLALHPWPLASPSAWDTWQL